jgi:transcriptional regulator with XRE-family HTH domain
MAKPSPIHAGGELLVALGIANKKARQAAGISQEALAVNSGLDRSYIDGIECGEHNLSHDESKENIHLFRNHPFRTF